MTKPEPRHATPAEHYREAERLLEAAVYLDSLERPFPHVNLLVARAQVHAILATAGEAYFT